MPRISKFTADHPSGIRDNLRRQLRLKKIFENRFQRRFTSLLLLPLPQAHEVVVALGGQKGQANFRGMLFRGPHFLATLCVITADSALRQ